MKPAGSNDDRSLRIIHIEDDPCDAELIAAALEVHALSQITTVTTKLALAAEIQTELPDLIISDSNLPGFDGLSALAFATQHCPGIPFVFCSGFLSAEKQAQALAHGAVDCVSKNDLTRLIALVKKLAAPAAGQDETQG